MKKIYALLIGINEYSVGNELYGCLNDVANIEGYLTQLPDCDLRLRKLTNTEATKSNVVQAISEHLGSAEDGDVALLYFSGHGVQEDAPDWSEQSDDQYLECIVCCDQINGHFLLADKEMRFLFGRFNPGVQLVTIFDCCHSGDNTRDFRLAAMSSNDKKNNSAQEERTRRYNRSFQKRQTVDFIFSEELMSGDAFNGSFQDVLPNYPHIHLAACMSFEKAIETGGQGLFTRFLVETLDAHKSRLRFDEIRGLAKMYFFDKKKSQIPDVRAVGHGMSTKEAWLWLGFDLGDEDGTDLMIGYSDSKNAWLLNAGSLHGIGMDMAVLADVDGSMETFTVDEVYLEFARLSVSVASGQLMEGRSYPARTKARIPTDAVFALVDLDCNPELKEKLSNWVEKSDLVDDPQNADYHIVIFNDFVYFTKPYDHYRPLAEQMSVLGGNDIDGGALVTDIKILKRLHKARNLYNPSAAKLKKTPFTIEVSSEKNSVFRDATNGYFTIKSNGSTNPVETLFFAITNNTGQRLYASALMISEDGQVRESLFDEAARIFDPFESYETGGQRFGLSTDKIVYNWPKEECLIKFVVSKRQIDLSMLLQDGMPPPYTELNADVYVGAQRGYMGPVEEEVPDWFTIDVRVIIENEDYNNLSLVADKLDDETLGPFIDYNYFNLQTADAFVVEARPKEGEGKRTEKGFVGSTLIKLGNAVARKRRHRRFKRQTKHKSNPKVFLSEGDSWFQHPLVHDTIDHLMNSFNVLSLGAAGDTLRNIIQSNELSKAIEREENKGTNIAGIIISGGGNDILDKALLKFLQENDDDDLPGQRPERFMSPLFFDEVDKIMALYGDLMNTYGRYNFFSHGYDYVIPNPVGKNKGWLGKYMTPKKIVDVDDRTAVAKYMLGYFNEQMEKLAKPLDNFFFVNNLDVLRSDQWYDEIHPNNEGFQDIALRIAKIIRANSDLS